VAQSYEYDHRNLRERIEHIAIPEEIATALGPRATETYALIISGQVSGPIVDEFKRVQEQHGDDAAFEYLAAEADGLHVTPYGFCVNAFTVDPCPRHIECFNGCRHLSRTYSKREQEALQVLRDRMAVIVKRMENEPPRRVGRANQLTHAKATLNNIDAALKPRPGTKPFPNGLDLYQGTKSKRRTSILDQTGRPSGSRSRKGRPKVNMDDA
jgi:hypothetical protein